jgi:hypothetical protein
MEVVYLETSVISLLVGNPSRDLIIAGNQQTTRDWWRLRRAHFVCVASSEVVREAADGDPQEALKRQGILAQLTILPFTDEADRMMKALLATRALPPKAQADAARLAVAAAAAVDYLLTWNCRHLANAQILTRLEQEARRLGWKLPRVCTPAELMGDSLDET